ncbi:MAG: hypothetical protein V4490_07170 [Pseudomonadota bacterium]
MLEILFEIMAGYWSARYSQHLVKKRVSYIKMFFTVWLWFSLGLGLLLILDGTFKTSSLYKFFIICPLVAAVYTALQFTFFYSVDRSKAYSDKKVREKKIVDKDNESP